MKTIILATKNKGKVREINAMFEGEGVRPPASMAIVFAPVDDYIKDMDVEEDGATYRENAYKKAAFVHERTGRAVVSEDSGLEVKALDWGPGIHSARYAGLKASDLDNTKKLIAAISGLPRQERSARYVCVLCLIDKSGRVEYFCGEVQGTVIETPRGVSGFGYDPIFIPEGFKKTFAELGQAVKNSISHRANAIRTMKDKLTANERE
jgi:XTP/dITP diphosphohydrolase